MDEMTRITNLVRQVRQLATSALRWISRPKPSQDCGRQVDHYIEALREDFKKDLIDVIIAISAVAMTQGITEDDIQQEVNRIGEKMGGTVMSPPVNIQEEKRNIEKS